MDYERKYKEALQRARLWKESNRTAVKQTIIEDIFPELAEVPSEDVRIRNEIISFLDRNTYQFECDKNKYKGWLAWLEKQDNKPQDKSALEATNEAKVDNDIKIKPKFKVGQWIVWQDKCYKVNYNGCGYELVDQNGLSTSLEYGTIDENAHIWDIIKDAKAGDVLASLGESDILIFRNLDTSQTFSSYYNILGKGNLCWSNDCFIPATKEQRDLLFQKMKEAGYEWDEEKLELKKIASDNAEQDRLPFIWHDAAKELPPKHDDDYSEEVLVHTLSGSIFMLRYNYSINRWTNSFRITHWAYLPESPKTE